MESRLIHANVVVAAQQFNPSIFSQLWLIDNNIAAVEDFNRPDAFTMTPPLVQLRAERFVLLVVHEQLQFAPQPLNDDSADLVCEKVGAIVRRLPETPYVAVGLNFIWQLIPADNETNVFGNFCRTLFFRDNPLFRSFDSGDARFGGYLSKNIFGARLKLDIKPTKVVRPAGTITESMQFAFNYNRDLTRPNMVEQIEQLLARWDEAGGHAGDIVRGLRDWEWQQQ